MKYEDVIKTETITKTIEVTIDSKMQSFMQEYNIDPTTVMKLALKEIEESMNENKRATKEKVVVVQEPKKEIKKEQKEKKPRKIPLKRDTIEANQSIIELLRNGYTHKEISQILNMSPTNVYNRVWRYDLKAKANKKDYEFQDEYEALPTLKQRIIELLKDNEEGLTGDEIRRILNNYAPNSIYTELSRMTTEKKIISSNSNPKKYYLW